MTVIRRTALTLALTLAAVLGTAGTASPAQASFADSASRTTCRSPRPRSPPRQRRGLAHLRPDHGDHGDDLEPQRRRPGLRLHVTVYFSDGFVQVVDLGPTATSWSALDRAVLRHGLLGPVLGDHQDRLRLVHGVRADGVVPVLTALVVDDEPEGRWRLTDLLTLGGWDVVQAAGPQDALPQAALLEPDLIVIDASTTRLQAPALFRRLRGVGSRARFLLVAADPSEVLRAEAAAAGALACLPKPVDPRLLLSFLRSRTTGLAAQDNTQAALHLADIREIDDLHEAEIDADLDERLQEIYATTLPGRLTAIASGARSGDPVAVASAALTLAGTSGQLGYREVASLCQAIARDARRGVVAHARLVELRRSPSRPDPRPSCGSLADSGRLACGCSRKVVCVSGKTADTDTGRTDMSSKNRHRHSSTARKVVGSLGVLGTAAAVAGMGTFGSFTDSTAPVATTIQSGTLSIDVSQQGYAVPVTTTGFVPGDSLTRAVNLVNDGNSALGSVTLSSSATVSSVLTTDVSNGLQLTVKKCSVAWTQGGTAPAPTYTAPAPRPSSAPARRSTT